jgi:Protein of unknown function (DUF2752)
MDRWTPRPPGRGGGTLRRRVEGGLGVAAVAGLALAVRAADPRVPGRWPTCPVHALTGLACPGCGSLRAAGALVHGQLLEAVDYNALLVVALPVAALAWGRSVLGAGRRPRRRAPVHLGPAVLVTLVLWTIVRNLPAWPLTVLAP